MNNRPLTIRMEKALQSAWTDREGVMRVDHTSYRTMATLRGLQSRGLVEAYSHVVTEAGRQWLAAHSAG